MLVAASRVAIASGCPSRGFRTSPRGAQGGRPTRRRGVASRSDTQLPTALPGLRGPLSLPLGQTQLCSSSASEANSAAEEGSFVLEPIGDGTCYHLRDGKQFSHAEKISLPLEDNRVVVGRKEAGKADLGVDVGSLSARHAEFIVARGRLFVKDLGSTNGTIVNDKYLSAGEERQLKAGQTVILGDEHLAAFRVNVTGQSANERNSLLGAFSGLFSDSSSADKKRKSPLPTPPAVVTSPAPAAQAVPKPMVRAADSVKESTTGPDAGKVAGTVVLGTASSSSATPQEAILAAQEALGDSQADAVSPPPAVIEVASPGVEPSTFEAPTTSSAVVTSPQGDKVVLQGKGGQVEQAGPFGIMSGLSEVTGRLGAAITNSQVQVNYQYKPVIQFNTGGKPLGPGEVKSALLVAIAGKERGLSASENDITKIELLARSLEAHNPTPAPLKSPLLNGRWALQYTTCKSALQGGGGGILRPNGPIHQTVDIFNLKVLNEASFSPLPFLKWKNSASSNLNAQSNSRAQVKPDQFRVGPFKVNAPPTSPARAALQWEMNAMGNSSDAWLDTTYLDADLRISRNSNGDVFVFVRDDPNDQ